jgi:hypothetical protein
MRLAMKSFREIHSQISYMDDVNVIKISAELRNEIRLRKQLGVSIINMRQNFFKTWQSS